jgi:hypothetical protein
MSIEPRSVNLPRALRRTVRIYSNLESFLRHLFKHVLDAKQSVTWNRYLPTAEAHWKALGQTRYVKGGASGLMATLPESTELVDRLYGDVAQFIADGLHHADATPIFARLIETWRNPRTDVTRETENIEALSPEGCILIVRGPVLRTAYFATGRSTAPYDIYWAGLHAILARVARVQHGARWYSDDEGTWRTGLSVELHTPESLTNTSNPWPKPAARRAAAPLERDELEEAIIARYLHR